VKEIEKGLYDASFLPRPPGAPGSRRSSRAWWCCSATLSTALRPVRGFLLVVLSTYQASIPELGTVRIDLGAASATLRALLRYREAADRVRHALDQMLAS
jgi:hypothetical protein